jgi:hypothetical protein
MREDHLRAAEERQKALHDNLSVTVHFRDGTVTYEGPKETPDAER